MLYKNKNKNKKSKHKQASLSIHYDAQQTEYTECNFGLTAPQMHDGISKAQPIVCMNEHIITCLCQYRFVHATTHMCGGQRMTSHGDRSFLSTMFETKFLASPLRTPRLAGI